MVIKTFKELCLVYKDGQGGPKLDKLVEKLQDFSTEWKPGVGLIVNKVENPKIVVVSHMDLIRKFQKGFEVGEDFIEKKETLVGALDNTITNAVLVEVILALPKDALDDIEFLFSEGEEVGMVGMSNYLEQEGERIRNAFFINLDVTNEGYGYHASIEYDLCNFNMLKQIQSIESEHNLNWFYTGFRVCDDIDAVKDAGCHGLSYCLPTKGNIHSYKNKCRKDSVEPFKEGLLTLIKHLKDMESLNNDIKPYQFKEALTAASKDEIVVKQQTLFDNIPFVMHEEPEEIYFNEELDVNLFKTIVLQSGFSEKTERILMSAAEFGYLNQLHVSLAFQGYKYDYWAKQMSELSYIGLVKDLGPESSWYKLNSSQKYLSDIELNSAETIVDLLYEEDMETVYRLLKVLFMDKISIDDALSFIVNNVNPRYVDDIIAIISPPF